MLERLEDAREVVQRSRYVVSFDHHPAREEFADSSIRRVDAASASVLIEEFLSFCTISISPDVANCLFCGLVTDTGRFQYQNADPESFVVASRLVAAGAEPSRISLEVYQSQRIEYLHLESIVMGRIRTVVDGRVAFSYARAEDLEGCGVSQDECDGLVDIVRSVGGVEVCLFLKECGCDGKVRGKPCDRRGPLDVSGGRRFFLAAVVTLRQQDSPMRERSKRPLPRRFRCLRSWLEPIPRRLAPSPSNRRSRRVAHGKASRLTTELSHRGRQTGRLHLS